MKLQTYHPSSGGNISYVDFKSILEESLFDNEVNFVIESLRELFLYQNVSLYYERLLFCQLFEF